MPGQVAVLVLAAGSGNRVGGAPKQFRLLGEAPVVVQTLRAFQNHDAVDQLCVALPAGDTTVLAGFGLSKVAATVTGGTTRRASVHAALAATDASIILVHDAVRPFIEGRIISQVIDLSSRYGAAAAAIPVADSMRYAEGGQFRKTVDRKHLFRMQTPQGFRRSILEHALAQEADDTDEVETVIRTGKKVRYVEGSALNFKLTCPEDFVLAHQLWPYWRDRACA